MTNIPLYDHEAERHVLESLYLDPEKIYQARLKPEDFHLDIHRGLFLAMMRCYADGIEFDMKTLLDYGADSQLTFKVLSEAVTAANFLYHENTVLEKAFARKSQQAINGLVAEIGDSGFMAKFESVLNDLSDAQDIQPEKSIKGLLNDIHTNFVEAKYKEIGIRTGFDKLNDSCVGMYPRHLWMIGGLTSAGKSTILSQIVDDICYKGAGVVIFSVEDSRQDKLTRLISTISGVPIKYIVRGTANEQEIISAMGRITEYNLHVYDDIYTLDEIEMKVKKHVMRDKVEIVMVDFVQNIITKGEDIYSQMKEVAIRLQKMAKRHGVCVVALSQMTGEKLRGAQELESAADIVLWINREYGKMEFELIIKKNRPFGTTGKLSMAFTNNWTGITEA